MRKVFFYITPLSNKICFTTYRLQRDTYFDIWRCVYKQLSAPSVNLYTPDLLNIFSKDTGALPHWMYYHTSKRTFEEVTEDKFAATEKCCYYCSSRESFVIDI